MTQAVQYGCQVKAAAVYLTQYQQLPVDRTAQALCDLFGLSVSTGSVQNYIGDAAGLLTPMVERIKPHQSSISTRPACMLVEHNSG